VTGLTLSSLKLSIGSGANLLTSTQTLTTTDNITWTVGNLAALTKTSAVCTLALSPSAAVKDTYGNALVTGATANFTIDATRPPRRSRRSPLQPNTPITQLTIAFSEPVKAWACRPFP